MIFGLDGFTGLHIAISLVAIAAGFVVIGGFLADARLNVFNDVFLATTVATSVTGFVFPFTKLQPSHIVAVISLVVLAVAIYAYYTARLAGRWRSAYVVAATTALYLNVFVLVAQTFLKNPALLSLAPTQTEFPFVAAQAATILAFAIVGYIAVSRFGNVTKLG